MVLHKGETFEHVYLNEPALDVHIVQEADSHVKIHVINLPDNDRQEEVTNLIHVDHAGTGCSTEIYAVACVGANNKINTRTRVHHDVGEGISRQLIKFVLRDYAQGSFEGELKIRQDAQHVDAQQLNRNLILTPTASMRTQPQLEIYADDVQASHGASTGQLDESALFYMRQRGIDEQTARRMLVGAFLKDVLETLSDVHQRETLMDAIDRIV